MPVRKVSNKGGNHIGMFYSTRLKQSMPYESTGHRDCLILINYYKDTVRFETEPLTIPYFWDGKLRHYTPDILVERVRKRKLLIECKRAKQAITEENQRKFAAATNYVKEEGMEFEVWITEEIRSGFRLRNVNMLTRFAVHEVDEAYKQSFLQMLRTTNEPVTVAQLAYAIDQVNYYERVDDIFSMVFFHELYLPIDKEKITPLSRIYLPIA